MTLTAERLREMLTYDPLTGIFTRKVQSGTARIGDVAGGDGVHYVYISIDNRKHLAHRLAWLYVHGEWPEMDLDHVDENKHNNRIANLREASRSLNGHNQSGATRPNVTGRRGVILRKDSGKYHARVTVDGVIHLLGDYDDPAQAELVYLEAKKRLTGVETKRTILSASKSV